MKGDTNNQNETGMFVGMIEEIFNNNNNNNDDKKVKINNNNYCKNYNFCGFSDMSENWLVDPGATSHITMNDKFMTNIEMVHVKVTIGDGKEIVCKK